MTNIAHVINPVAAAETSDLRVAQPITFETLRRARETAAGAVMVRQYVVKLHDETPPLPNDFSRLPDIPRTVCDLHTFTHRRSLPLIRDILDRLYHAATDAEYLVYTNVDIALQPHFYLAVNDLLAQGHDALIINRRTIDKRFSQIAELPQMYAAEGAPHPGYDCFVFRRDVYPQYQLGNICLGMYGVGAALGLNLVWHATRFKEFTDLHLTFHIGDDKLWKSSEFQDYWQHNSSELRLLWSLYQNRQPSCRHDFIDQLARRFQLPVVTPRPNVLRRAVRRLTRKFL